MKTHHLPVPLRVVGPHPGAQAPAATTGAEGVSEAALTSPLYRPGLVKHIVLFRYQEAVTAAQRAEVVRRFLALRESVRPGDVRPYILSIAAGGQNSGEGKGRGYEQGFIVSFGSEGDRNFYVGTPVVNDPAYCDGHHAAFKAFVRPLLAKENGVLVFDFTDTASRGG